MLLGRVFGYALIALAVIMASADAVLALGPGDHAGIATADMIMLLWGNPNAVVPGMSLLGRLGAVVLATPAWLVVLMMGATLAVTARKRQRRYRFRTYR